MASVPPLLPTEIAIDVEGAECTVFDVWSHVELATHGSDCARGHEHDGRHSSWPVERSMTMYGM